TSTSEFNTFFDAVPGVLIGMFGVRCSYPSYSNMDRASKGLFENHLVKHSGGQGGFKNGSRRRKEADSGAKNTSASLPRRLRPFRRFLNSPRPEAGAGKFCFHAESGACIGWPVPCDDERTAAQDSAWPADLTRRVSRVRHVPHDG